MNIITYVAVWWLVVTSIAFLFAFVLKELLL